MGKIYQNLDFLDGHFDKCPFAALRRMITQTEYAFSEEKSSFSYITKSYIFYF